jgi:hypothetical protein
MTTSNKPGPYLEIHPTAVLIFFQLHNRPVVVVIWSMDVQCRVFKPSFLNQRNVHMHHDGPRNWGLGKSLMGAH